ncbi:uncharacterized protein LOC127154201 [Labeo rohita]|uniref:uncharacterized protein LOC127154201 n=1 Tax=Labeo rohita TaxID=84645 RepID=UPI0021E25AF8|nr:uncharacterized protein LOC127154201 [Labeo rohita]
MPGRRTINNVEGDDGGRSQGGDRSIQGGSDRGRNQGGDRRDLEQEEPGVFGVVSGEMKTLSVMEGDSVTLHTDTDIQGNDAVIEWMFGPENPDTVIAEINRAANISDVTDDRFRDRVKMNSKTGSLTITNIRTTDSGLYKAEITINAVAVKTLSVTLYAVLPVPVIIRDTSRHSPSSGSSSVSKCSLLCSVVNVSDVTLSWYKGNSLISSISVFNLNISLSLPLEAEYQDKNTYSCVINNNISNQTQHLDISQLISHVQKGEHRRTLPGRDTGIRNDGEPPLQGCTESSHIPSPQAVLRTHAYHLNGKHGPCSTKARRTLGARAENIAKGSSEHSESFHRNNSDS